MIRDCCFYPMTSQCVVASFSFHWEIPTHPSEFLHVPPPAILIVQESDNAQPVNFWHVTKMSTHWGAHDPKPPFLFSIMSFDGYMSLGTAIESSTFVPLLSTFWVQTPGPKFWVRAWTQLNLPVDYVFSEQCCVLSMAVRKQIYVGL